MTSPPKHISDTEEDQDITVSNAATQSECP